MNSTTNHRQPSAHLSEDHLIELLELARQSTVEAGKLTLELRNESLASPDTKSSVTDPVSLGDRAAENAIVSSITKERPHDAIQGEEGTERGGTSGITWSIDPIDGTANYLYGLPTFTVSVAAISKQKILAGAVYNPSTKELFAAAVDMDATCNNKPIHCTDSDTLATSLIATGFSYLADRRAQQAQLLAGVLPKVRDIRRLGSAALDLCLVASGRVDAYYEQGLHLWDAAAGVIIARQAGAVVCGRTNNEPSTDFTIAAGPGISTQLRELLVATGETEQNLDRTPFGSPVS